MRLEMGTFPVHDIVFGQRTRWSDGQLEIDMDELLAAVREDPRLEKAEIELARPGDSTRIWPKSKPNHRLLLAKRCVCLTK